MAVPHKTSNQLRRHLAEGHPLYVRNTAQMVNPVTGQATRFQMPIEYNMPGGQVDSWCVPRTNISFDLCEYVPAEALANSVGFLKLWTEGKFLEISEEEYTQEHRDAATVTSLKRAIADANNTARARAPGNDRARARLEEKVRLDNRGGADPEVQALKDALDQMRSTLAEAGMKMPGLPEATASAPKSLAVGATFRSSRYHAFEGQIKARTEQDERIPDEEVIDGLTDLLGDMSRADLETASTSALYSPRVQAWARARLATAIP